jgi:hypothetical protein
MPSSVEVGISIVPDTDSLDRNRELVRVADEGGLARPPGWSVETLAAFVEDGFDTLVFWPVDISPRQVELLTGEVVPHL